MMAKYRWLLGGAILAAAVATPSAASARVCDPAFRPLCLSPCVTGLPGRAVEGGKDAADAASRGDVKGVVESARGIVFVVCPA